jgi:tetratricopeptide (TPR) repeat protein
MATPHRRSTFGPFLKELREAEGLDTALKLANRLVRSTEHGERNYSRSAVAAIEAGAPPGDSFIVALIQAFPAREAEIRAAAAASLSLVSPPSASAVVAALRTEIEALRRTGNDPKVIRYHESFSRFLFLEAEHDTRVLLGTATEEAAARLGERAVQAAALIDDLGWSHYMLGNRDEAQRSIKDGIDLADAYGLPFWQAKGYRHLSGMALEAGNYEEAADQIDKARERAEAIIDEKDRSEMQAGIAYANALIRFANQDFDGARDALAMSENLRALADDHSRAVKVHAMFGKIFERQGKMGLALDKFREGLAASRAVGRRDEEVRNLAGLSRVLRAQGRDGDAERYAIEARELGQTVPVPYEQLTSTELR